MEEKTIFSLLVMSITYCYALSPLRTLMRQTAMLRSGIWIALAILTTVGTSMPVFVPAQIPTTIENSSMNWKVMATAFT